MKRAALILLLIALSGLGTSLPLLATAGDCVETGDVECCDLECVLCVCCSHTPQTFVDVLDPGEGHSMDGRVGFGESEKPRAPYPRDLLHVPR